MRFGLRLVSRIPYSLTACQTSSVISRTSIQPPESLIRLACLRFPNTFSVRFNSAETSTNPSGDSKPAEGAPVKEGGGTEVENQLRAELSKINGEIATYKEKAADFEDKYLRSLAEMENLRTRLTKQISDGKRYATQSFCKDLTEIEDILQLAISSIPADQVNTNKHLKELYEGLKMTDARLLQVFKNHGLSQINPLGQKFNPNEHEAVVQQEVQGKESGTVTFVTKIGYRLHDRVIRPAVVGVAK